LAVKNQVAMAGRVKRETAFGTVKLRQGLTPLRQSS
jgi:hypothetical protein